jgi:transcriptional regulator with XRE-family HTH domain
MHKMKQNQIAQELGISKSYLSMILSGKRKPTPELLAKLQATPGIHKFMNFQSCEASSKQWVVGSSPPRDAFS